MSTTHTSTGPLGDGRTWTFDLPLTTPLSMNDREHWRKKARQVAQLRRDVQVLVRQARVPALERIAVELHYAPRDARRRDALNLVATLKVVEDAIVDAGVVPDDTGRWVEPTMPVLDPPTGRGEGRLFVVVRELPPVVTVLPAGVSP